MPASTRSLWPWWKPWRRPWKNSRYAGTSASWAWSKSGTCASVEVEDRLRALYDGADYPSWERVQGCFGVRWNYFSVSTPQVLQTISARLFTREQAKATVQWNEMLDEIRLGLRLTFKELVDALVDKLTPKPDGTRKKLVGVERLLEFLDTFSKQNVANDEQLQDLVGQVRGILKGQDIASLRKDQDLRELVKERMESAKVILDTPGRGRTVAADCAAGLVPEAACKGVEARSNMDAVCLYVQFTSTRLSEVSRGSFGKPSGGRSSGDALRLAQMS